MKKEEIKELIGQMTLEEKVSLLVGGDFWHTQEIERLGIPKMMLSDGPHGLRKQDMEADHLGINESIKAVCFPAGCATAASFDKDLIYKMGEAIGEEAQAENVGVVLGPAMNIKRSPLCGRNFEYYSEDPLVSTEIAGALIGGIQSKNVGTSAKHFAANNQEFHRLTVSSDMDERTLHEIYLASFEGAVRKQKPWTIMNSYNCVNGEHTGESDYLLTEILRNRWGFDGFVMTDWGAMTDKVKSVAAGCDLEMPTCNGKTDHYVIDAVSNGSLDEAVVDTACERILNILYRYHENKDQNAVFDRERDHQIAREVAEGCIVLLKNEDKILPLKREEKVAFIGQYAKSPRYQGGGSSHINSFKVDSAYDIAKDYGLVVRHSMGFRDKTDEIDEEAMATAVSLAKESDKAILFVGLPDSMESESYDRAHMKMPKNQEALIDAVVAVQPNTIVVLHNGSPIEMPWIDKVKGVVECYLGGQGVGYACANVLYGKVNPSGRLAESFPIRLQDNPSYLTFGGENDHAMYAEGLFVGYRYYTSKEMPVLFPFGYGLSYTEFSYSNLTVDKKKLTDKDTVIVSVDVTNTGDVAGKEVVELYVHAKESDVIRPVRELKGFEKVELMPGETKTVTFTLDDKAFSYWNTNLHDWYVKSDEYEIMIGKNANEMILTETVFVEGTKKLPRHYTLSTPLGVLMKDEEIKEVMHPIYQKVLGSMMAFVGKADQISDHLTIEDLEDPMTIAMLVDMPCRQAVGYVYELTTEEIEEALEKIND